MDRIDEKIGQYLSDLHDPRLALRETEWMAAFEAAGEARSGAGLGGATMLTLTMALGIGLAGAVPGSLLPGASEEPADQDILTPFSIEAPLAPSTLLAE
ncbi:hypothetical protein N5J77_29085 [Sphingobium yanoikuyae]|uniref:Uncharacterized protein n=1 Tax=Sphingobium yanoikuyae TaxID=13690 RepID=A0A9X7UHE7_SPHYA|nr:hypothetical protein [Sphingobium yanoikuyae]MDH2135188.1 hypothetical protein [Sphingobium yanoikuyae]MDH2170526.1 hypothetical protein [Sphingobium yanoikuyae]QNG49724.1 hypothetical protein H3V42_33370 [Sphingobium yanoikuyae]